MCRRFLFVPMLLLAVSCGKGSTTGQAAAGRDAGGAAPVASDPRVHEVVRALEAGLPDAAWTLLDQLGDSLGVDGPLLRARAALMEGDGVGALREVESARELAPEDARVFATEAEVLVVLDRLDGARDALREGWKLAGRTAALERARGVLMLRTPGGAREGLAALEQALELDPELPFVAFPLAQAHLLVGRMALGDGAPDEALAHARAALEEDPASDDFLELEAEALAAALRFEEALEVYARLEEDGRDVGETRALLQQRYATKLLLENDRAGAVASYLAARELGLDDTALGFGADVLRDEANTRIDAGVARFEAGDLEGARSLFEEALRYDPDNLEAENHLGVCRFRAEDYRGAAEVWGKVLSSATEQGIELPDPVHLNLARAWRLAGEPAEARRVLSTYLDREPEGVWSEETREMLAALEAEELVGGDG